MRRKRGRPRKQNKANTTTNNTSNTSVAAAPTASDEPLHNWLVSSRRTRTTRNTVPRAPIPDSPPSQPKRKRCHHVGRNEVADELTPTPTRANDEVSTTREQLAVPTVPLRRSKRCKMNAAKVAPAPAPTTLLIKSKNESRKRTRAERPLLTRDEIRADEEVNNAASCNSRDVKQVNSASSLHENEESAGADHDNEDKKSLSGDNDENVFDMISQTEEHFEIWDSSASDPVNEMNSITRKASNANDPSLSLEKEEDSILRIEVNAETQSEDNKIEEHEEDGTEISQETMKKEEGDAEKDKAETVEPNDLSLAKNETPVAQVESGVVDWKEDEKEESSNNGNSIRSSPTKQSIFSPCDIKPEHDSYNTIAEMRATTNSETIGEKLNDTTISSNQISVPSQGVFPQSSLPVCELMSRSENILDPVGFAAEHGLDSRRSTPVLGNRESFAELDGELDEWLVTGEISPMVPSSAEIGELETISLRVPVAERVSFGWFVEHEHEANERLDEKLNSWLSDLPWLKNLGTHGRRISGYQPSDTNTDAIESGETEGRPRKRAKSCGALEEFKRRRLS